MTNRTRSFWHMTDEIDGLVVHNSFHVTDTRPVSVKSARLVNVFNHVPEDLLEDLDLNPNSNYFLVQEIVIDYDDLDVRLNTK
jgi:hypothetical protein